MATKPTRPQYPELDGAEDHHDLKNKPGDAGDADHTQTDGKLDENVEAAVEKSDADTQIADELKRAVTDDD